MQRGELGGSVPAHTLGASGITAYLKNGGTLEKAAQCGRRSSMIAAASRSRLTRWSGYCLRSANGPRRLFERYLRYVATTARPRLLTTLLRFQFWYQNWKRNRHLRAGASAACQGSFTMGEPRRNHGRSFSESRWIDGRHAGRRKAFTGNGISARVAPQYRQTAAKYCQPLGKLPSTCSFSEPAALMIFLQQGHRADIVASDLGADERDAAVRTKWESANTRSIWYFPGWICLDAM